MSYIESKWKNIILKLQNRQFTIEQSYVRIYCNLVLRSILYSLYLNVMFAIWVNRK